MTEPGKKPGRRRLHSTSYQVTPQYVETSEDDDDLGEGTKAKRRQFLCTEEERISKECHIQPYEFVCCQVMPQDVENSEDVDELEEGTKTTRRRYTFAQKKLILEECNTESYRFVSDKYKINIRVLRKWQLKKPDIVNAAHSNSAYKKKMVDDHEKLDAAVSLWIMECNKKGTPITGGLVRKKAFELNKTLGGPSNFKASSGWLEKFQKRNNIRCLNMTGKTDDPGKESGSQRLQSNSCRVRPQEVENSEDVDDLEEGTSPQQRRLSFTDGERISEECHTHSYEFVSCQLTPQDLENAEDDDDLEEGTETKQRRFSFTENERFPEKCHTQSYGSVGFPVSLKDVEHSEDDDDLGEGTETEQRRLSSTKTERITEECQKQSVCFQVTPQDVEHSEDDDDLGEGTKTKRRRFSFAEKERLLDECNTHSYKFVSDKYKINIRVLRKWRLQKTDIVEAAQSGSAYKKKMADSHKELDAAVLSWIIECNKKGTPITGELMKKKAFELNKVLGGPPNFKASSGWLDKFKKRNNMRCSEITGKMTDEPRRLRLRSNSSHATPQNVEISEDVDESGRGTKTTRRRYTFAEKKRILEECNTQSYEFVSDKYKISIRVLKKWQLKKPDIVNAAHSRSAHKKKMTDNHEELDAAVSLWIMESNKKGTPITGGLVRKKAFELNKALGGQPNFKASSGWLEKFQKRNNIRCLNMTGGKSSSDVEAAIA